MTDTNNTDGAALEPVTVTQADREAAAEYMRLFPDLRLPEAFARHRQSHSLPGAVGMREALTLARNHIEQNAPCDGTLEIIDAALTPSALSGDAGETLESIIAWGDQTFGPCSQERAIERAWEEWQEMLEKGADVPIEAADVIICLLRIPGILDAINRKMTINRGRTWDVRPDGTGYHVKAAALQHKGEVSRG